MKGVMKKMKMRFKKKGSSSDKSDSEAIDESNKASSDENSANKTPAQPLNNVSKGGSVSPDTALTNNHSRQHNDETATNHSPPKKNGAPLNNTANNNQDKPKETSSPPTKEVLPPDVTVRTGSRDEQIEVVSGGEGGDNPCKKIPIAVEESGEFSTSVFQDSPKIIETYSKIPVLEQTDLPRGGLSIETKAVGRVQFGIPPETIKDSMQLGIPVPQVYIVPVERFCREMGPALGVNLAEFEFPAYFNFFVYKKQCTLVVDSADAEENIRRVFSETLLGPAQFRRKDNPLPYEKEDFAPGFPREAIPNMQKELEHFRMLPGGKELTVDLLLEFCHFDLPSDGHEKLGVPPAAEEESIKQLQQINDEFNSDDEEMEVADEEDDESSAVPVTAEGVEEMRKQKAWSYSRAKFMGDVSTVWPAKATEQEKKDRSVPRIEIFKMPGGTEYIVHDIDTNNHIIGKARFSGHVKVKESIGVIGYEEGNEEAKKALETADEGSLAKRESIRITSLLPKKEFPKTFHPPSFGVTVLGNSHGFDKSGSVSGYVLWINGRGVMIDPPPYSSATLEREGIRPRMIVGIILTHCHADHDAGAFQKVLTGSQVVVITTPTIYKSFIRKYAALSALSPALLRHSHRYKPAIIGQPLRFQGAIFHFIYTLHSIPCVGFRVVWRGRSMVFTGDHFNNPEAIEQLQEKGILSKARSDDLNNLPLQETDLLLHEAGAPPIHTPLDVLMKLPERVKERLYVVHTSALPEGCDLRVAPTGTAGTIRLDQMHHKSKQLTERGTRKDAAALLEENEELFMGYDANNEYIRENRPEETSESTPERQLIMATSFANLAYSNTEHNHKRLGSSLSNSSSSQIPLVSLRPASSTDAWFTLNLLSAVPFLSSLSYASTMEVLETARVDAYCQGEIVVPADRRGQYLCVVWEGTCAERKKVTSVAGTKAAGGKARSSGFNLFAIEENAADEGEDAEGALWYAGDWTAPIALQPEKRLSAESHLSTTHDVVAISKEGVKVITVDFSNLDIILKNGSPLYGKYLERRAEQQMLKNTANSVGEKEESQSATEILLGEALKNLNILELLNCNSALRKLSAVQKRHLECLAEGPVSFLPGERIWRAGAPVDKAFVIVSGTASFVPRRRNTGIMSHRKSGHSDGDKVGHDSHNKANINNSSSSIGEEMVINAIKAIKELGSNQRLQEDSSLESSKDEDKGIDVDAKKKGMHIHFDRIFTGGTGEGAAAGGENTEYAKLGRSLQRRADKMLKAESSDRSLNSSLCSSERQEELDYSFGDSESAADDNSKDRRNMLKRRRSSKARFANKVLGRLYSRRAFTGGLIFSRGHFLGDVSKMVAGRMLSSDSSYGVDDDSAPSYGFGDASESGRYRRAKEDDGVSVNLSELVIHEREGDHHVMHSSTLTAGKDGCVVLVFNKMSLIPFLDEYPGLLLSLLGTQVIV